jgi:ParB/RepB/Spo0J family partition protein
MKPFRLRRELEGLSEQELRDLRDHIRDVTGGKSGMSLHVDEVDQLIGARFGPGGDGEKSPAEAGTLNVGGIGAEVGELIHIAIGDTAPSATNPRTVFPEHKLLEMAESIRERGVLEPLIVRPWPEGRSAPEPLKGLALPAPKKSWLPKYEVVCGERRYRASIIAGKKTVPVIVRLYSDRDAEEIQNIENLHREDLREIDEAVGYQRMVDKFGYTPEELATRLHKSKSHVYQRLKLAKNSDDFMIKAIDEGRLDISVAQMIVTIEPEDMRQRAARELAGGKDHDGYSFRQAERHIRERYQRQLKGAPFSMEDGTLPGPDGTPQACGDCVFQTKNNRAVYGEGGRGDMCHKPDCFQKRVLVVIERVRDREYEAGFKVISGKEATPFFDWQGNLSYQQEHKFMDLEKRAVGDPHGRQLQDVLGGVPDWRQKVQPIAVTHESGKVLRLIPKKEAEELLRKVLPRSAWVKPKRESSETSKADRKRQLINARYAVAVRESVYLAAKKKARSDSTIRALGMMLLDATWHDSLRAVAARHGLMRAPGAPKKRGPAGHVDPGQALRREMAKVSYSGVVGTLFEIMAARLGPGTNIYMGSNRDFEAACKTLGVDLKGLKKRVQKEVENGSRKKKAPAKKFDAAKDARDRIAGAAAIRKVMESRAAKSRRRKRRG